MKELNIIITDLGKFSWAILLVVIGILFVSISTPAQDRIGYTVEYSFDSQAKPWEKKIAGFASFNGEIGSEIKTPI